ncbi:FG-GAP-like repeat-containing protein [Nannocystis radixulma]|nr:FG-GAP-like repeat-containing protein [Nannocystis radixulma]
MSRYIHRPRRLLVLAAVVLPGCDSVQSSDQAELPSWQEFRAAATRVVDGQERYVLDGDLPVDLPQVEKAYADLVAAREGNAPRSIVNLNKGAIDRWQGGQEQDLRYCITDEFGPLKDRVVHEMSQATRSWEQAGHVDFRYVPASDADCKPGGAVTFAVKPWDSGGAMAFFPSSSESLRILYIDYDDFDTNPAWDESSPRMNTVGVLRHELGHTLGLRHEHTRELSSICFEDSEWAELSEYDSRSVMHYQWCAGGTITTDYTLTISDQEGARALYGPPAVVRHDSKVPVDFDHDGRSDLALIGSTEWKALPVAFAGAGGFNVTRVAVATLAKVAGQHGADIVTGDFDGDGRTDIAVTGARDWKSIPVALSRGDGDFEVLTPGLGEWPARATADNAQLLTGDFDGDGKTDLALLGPESWQTIPVALSVGDGSFTLVDKPSPDFAARASATGVRIVTGDFDGDGRTDIALTGGRKWSTVPVALSNGDGSFRMVESADQTFAAAAAAADTVVLAGDFDGDGKTDLALTGASTSKALHVALSKGDGTFTVTAQPTGELGGWAEEIDAHVLAGDFDGDGKTDLALVGKADTLPVARSRGDGTFELAARATTTFGSRIKAGANVIVGDFDGDGRSDMAMTGPSTWSTIPTAYSQGDGSFTVTEENAGEFANLASHEGAHVL